MIYLIFRNVQEEFESKHRMAKPAPAVLDTVPKVAEPAPAAAPVATAVRTSPSKSKAMYWVAGGAVAAGAAGLLYVLLDDPEPKHHTIVIPE
jgi:hypothetical protein